jgi:putative hydrolase of the HAD superfamily
VKIEAVLFDLGKVLINFSFEPVVKTLHESCSVSRAQLEAVLWDKVLVRRYERGEISTEQFHNYLCERASLNMTLPQFCATWSSVFMPDPLVSEELLANLKRRYPLILISNTNEAHVEFIREKYRVFGYFDHLIFSHEVGALKPDPKIFEHAIALSNRSAEELFFTDDREENIVAAKALGIHAHQFVSEEKLVEALRQAGVEI